MATKSRIAIIGCAGLEAADMGALARRSGADEILLVGVGNKIFAEIANRIQPESPSEKIAKMIPASVQEAASADLAVIAGDPQSGLVDRVRNDVRTTGLNVRRNVRELVDHGFDGVLLVAVYPTDLMTEIALSESGLPPARVIGIGLEGSEWFSRHGKIGSSAWCSADCSYVGFFDDCDPQCSHFSNLDRPVPIKAAGGLATCVTTICEAILHDQNQIYPVSTLMEAPQDTNGVYMTVPCVLGRRGVRSIIQPNPTKKVPNVSLHTDNDGNIIRKLDSLEEAAPTRRASTATGGVSK